jgi:riboflavin kinase/FMN adenylyltransferase
MRIVSGSEEAPPAPGGRAVAVGTFDGVHLGHRRVIASAVETARARGLPATVVTFEPHPLKVLTPDDPPLLLATEPIKRDLIAGLGVDELVVLRFDDQLARMSPERFRDDVLVDRLAARHVSVGENFRFGHQARGDAALLRERGDLDVAVVPLFERLGEPVSSSRIRRRIGEGRISEANELLGSPFQLEGTVVKGAARGRTLGIPTANLAPSPDALLPAGGVYAGTALGHPAAINVGVRPTFESDGTLLVEAYLVNFDGDLYDSTLRLQFLERLRDEESFASAEELVEQMRRDVERVLEVHTATRDAAAGAATPHD